MFDEDEDLNVMTEKFLKRLQKTINKCFRKIQITERVDKEREDIFSKWKELKKKMDVKSKLELEKVVRS